MGHIRDSPVPTAPSARLWSRLGTRIPIWEVIHHNSSKEKTAFIVDNNLYEWDRLSFGLTNAPGTFQRLMNYLLRSVIRNICLFYLDDTTVFSKTKEEHFINLEHILDLLKESDLKLGLSKCKFMSESVQYLGHVISAKGITPDPEKIEQFKNYKRPTTIVEI
jgi:hypothetical protein